MQDWEGQLRSWEDEAEGSRGLGVLDLSGIGVGAARTPSPQPLSHSASAGEEWLFGRDGI